MSGAARIRALSTAWSRPCIRYAASFESLVGSRRSVGSGTGSSSRTELAGALHRLRSTLARARAELELAQTDGEPVPADRLVGDLGEALELLGAVEAAAIPIVPGLRLGGHDPLGGVATRRL